MSVPAISPVEKYTADVLPPERAAQLWSAMPSHIKPAVFERNLMNALAANPDLMRYDPRLIFREVAKAAGLGLLLDPLLGEGYIVTAYNYKSKQTEPQLRVGYKGMGKLARQSGDVATLYAHEVCALDQVEADQGVPKQFSHKPKLFGNRGDIVGYFAVITFKDGTFDFETMSVQDCQAIRDRSDAWKAYKADKIKSTPWSTDESEMSKKTVLRRLLKRQNQSPEMVAAQRIEDEAEFPHMIDNAPIMSRVPSAPPPAQIEAQAEKPADSPPAEHQATQQAINPHDGQARPAHSAAVAGFIKTLQGKRTEETLRKWKADNKASLDALTNDDDFNAVADAYTGHLQKLKGKQGADPISTGPQPQPAPAPTKASAPAQTGVPDIDNDYEGFLKYCTGTMNAATDSDVLETFFNTMIEPVRAQLFPPDFDGLSNDFQRNDRRLTTQ